MTNEQEQAIRCAYADLVGALQATTTNYEDHDWESHLESILDLEDAFPDIITEKFDD
jgi:hypothetical protein